jgi:hypothetical protein
MYENVNTKYYDMKIFCFNITEMSSYVETLDSISKFGKDGG